MIEDPMLFHRVARKVTQRLHGRTQGNSLLITSARLGEGKTFLSRMLAFALVRQGIASVVVIDCGGTDRSAHANPGSTWSDLLRGLPPAAELFRGIEPDQPTFLACGPSEPADLFRTGAVAHALELLSSRFGFVIIDGAILANCGVLSASADGCLLVIDAERTRREIVKGTLQANPIDPEKLLGAVLNRKPYYVPRWLYRRAF